METPYIVVSPDYLKQMTGIEPASPAWEAGVLPMNYICVSIIWQKSYLPT